MKKIILIDGNNFMFRSYYATIYSGSVMRTSTGLVTNALYGFTTMINKIIKEEEPEYMLVAFDIGKNFRHEKYKEYKGGRKETPEDLKKQMPMAKTLLDAMGIKYLEKEGFEADDIIGTVAKMCDENDDFDGLIISSDHDLLQLISKATKMKMLKSRDSILYDEKTFNEEYGFEPIKIIDLKALMGDSSDNIPGVKGIGEKTAKSLIQKYGSLDGVYDSLDDIKGKVKEKLEVDKENAYFSFDLATIYRDVPLDIKLDDLKYSGPVKDKLNKLYHELEFFSLLDEDEKFEKANNEYSYIDNIDDLPDSLEFTYFLECDNENYHFGNIIGLSLYDGKKSYIISKDIIKETLKKLNSRLRYTFDLKKNIVLTKNIGIDLINTDYDAMICYYLLNGNNKDDLSIKMNKSGIKCYAFKDLIKGKVSEEDFKEGLANKGKFIYDEKDSLLTLLEKEDMLKLFNEMEMPLITVLADMELTGIRLNEEVLIEMKGILEEKLNELTSIIHTLAGEEFNIASPKQLGDILFNKLAIPYPKRNPKTYSTDVTILTKVINKHEIIPYILEFRTLNKLLTTYVEPLKNFKKDDGKVHTIFKQTFTRTGRLSSAYPNLQNIPTRDDEGRVVKKAFTAEDGSVLLSADYSQIELRILAEISGDDVMINAFLNDEDIHKRIAAQIYNVSIDEVTNKQRSNAKHIVFGIVYGMSGFGLGEDLNISAKDAKDFIDKFYESFSGVKKYMEEIVEKSKTDGYVKTLFNRKRYIDEYKSPVYMIRKTAERLAQNTPIQGTGADIIKLAMISIYEKLNKNNLKSKLILQIHDEVILNVYEDEFEEVSKIVKESMENVVNFKVPLRVSMQTGLDWFETK